MERCVNAGDLLPDSLILRVMRDHTMRRHSEGTERFLLDGFPRTVDQAEALEQVGNVQLAVNLSLREEVGGRVCGHGGNGRQPALPATCERSKPRHALLAASCHGAPACFSTWGVAERAQVLVEKCLGRRLCKKCGKNYNIADIHLPASDGRPEIVMPPLNPPPDCADHLEQRADDTAPIILHRLGVYKQAAQPVEDFYSQRGKLINFEITGGIPQTLPRLLELLKPELEHVVTAASAVHTQRRS